MKLREFQSHIAQHSIDLAILVHPDINITYFTQQKISYGYLVITEKKAVLYHTKLDTPSSMSHITRKILRKGWEKTIQRGRRRMRIGINKESLTLASFERLKKLFPKARCIDIAKTLRTMRTIKTSQEISYMKKACDISTKAFELTIEELKKKTLQTEQDAALFLEKKMREQGGDIAFPTIVAMGKNAATPHHITSLAPLRNGFLLFDFGASYKNYCADISRTIYLGTPIEKERQLYAQVQHAQQKAIDAIQENIPLTTLDTLARKTLGKYKKYFTHSLGHGLGLEVHEAPSFVKKATVQRNVPFTIEPGIYIPPKLGIRIEDTLYWNGKICVLTQFPKHLLAIPKP